MRTLGLLTLRVQKGSDAEPARASIALLAGEGRDPVQLTPDCITLDELEACVNALQDELDLLRAEARRVFASGPGHA